MKNLIQEALLYMIAIIVSYDVYINTFLILDRLPEVEVVLQKEAGPDLNLKTERIEMETNPITKI